MTLDKAQVHALVRKTYGQTAREARAEAGTTGCCEPAPATSQTSACCGPAPKPAIPTFDSCCDSPISSSQMSALMGYSEPELARLPGNANLGLGCGNPGALADLREGETVVDLGSGAGIDCFLSALKVGPTGRVIGIDMTDEMLELAHRNARQGEFRNVDFRKGQIEQMPVQDGQADVIISNCVVNLSPDKPAVYREAFRVLKPGGRLAISDIVATAELPPEVREDQRLLTGCVAGAEFIADHTRWLEAAGFEQVSIKPRMASAKLITEWAPGSKLDDYVVSANIEARKPSS